MEFLEASVFVFLNGSGVGGVAVLPVFAAVVCAAPWLALTLPLFAVGRKTYDGAWLAFVPIANVLLLLRLVGGARREDANARLRGASLLAALPIQFLLFAWIWSWEGFPGNRETIPASGTVLVHWALGFPYLLDALFDNVLWYDDPYSSAAIATFFSGLATPFVHLLAFGWAWPGVARAAGQPPWLGWTAAIPIAGVVPQWAIALRAPATLSAVQ